MPSQAIGGGRREGNAKKLTRSELVLTRCRAWGVTGQWEWDGVVVEIALTFVRGAILADGLTTRPGEQEIQERDEKTSTDEQEVSESDRLRAFIAHIFCHVRHGVQQSIQRQADLNYYWPCVVGGLYFCLPPDDLPFGQRDGRPFLRQELYGRVGHGKVLAETLPNHLDIVRLTASAP